MSANSGPHVRFADTAGGGGRQWGWGRKREVAADVGAERKERPTPTPFRKPEHKLRNSGRSAGGWMGGRYFAPRVRKPRVRVKVKGRRRKGAAGDLDRDTQPHRFEHTKETTRGGSGAKAQHKTQRAYEPANTRVSDGSPFRTLRRTFSSLLCCRRFLLSRGVSPVCRRTRKAG